MEKGFHVWLEHGQFYELFLRFNVRKLRNFLNISFIFLQLCGIFVKQVQYSGAGYKITEGKL